MVGQVPSPTPRLATSGDSRSVTLTPSLSLLPLLSLIGGLCRAAIMPAVNQPALPPPTITTVLVIMSSHILAISPLEALRSSGQ